MRSGYSCKFQFPSEDIKYPCPFDHTWLPSRARDWVMNYPSTECNISENEARRKGLFWVPVGKRNPHAGKSSYDEQAQKRTDTQDVIGIDSARSASQPGKRKSKSKLREPVSPSKSSTTSRPSGRSGFVYNPLRLSNRKDVQVYNIATPDEFKHYLTDNDGGEMLNAIVFCESSSRAKLQQIANIIDYQAPKYRNDYMDEFIASLENKECGTKDNPLLWEDLQREEEIRAKRAQDLEVSEKTEMLKILRNLQSESKETRKQLSGLKSKYDDIKKIIDSQNDQMDIDSEASSSTIPVGDNPKSVGTPESTGIIIQAPNSKHDRKRPMMSSPTFSSLYKAIVKVYTNKIDVSKFFTQIPVKTLETSFPKLDFILADVKSQLQWNDTEPLPKCMWKFFPGTSWQNIKEEVIKTNCETLNESSIWMLGCVVGMIICTASGFKNPRAIITDMAQKTVTKADKNSHFDDTDSYWLLIYVAYFVLMTPDSKIREDLIKIAPESFTRTVRSA